MYRYLYFVMPSVPNSPKETQLLTCYFLECIWLSDEGSLFSSHLAIGRTPHWTAEESV